MKKTISVVLALAMVLMMSLSAFAYSFIVDTPKPEDPEDVEGWTAYYTEVSTKIAAINDDNQRSDAESEFRSEILNDVMTGAMSISTATQVLQALSGSTGEDSPLAGIIEQIQGVIGNLPSIEIPSELPSDFPSDITLPSIGGEENGNGSFLDTILGALGGIIDGIMGGGDSGDDVNGGDNGNTSGGDEDLWGSEGDDPFNDNSLGDTSVIAVSAVAVVAGAALVLTRKKSKDGDAE
ncbi:MAG: hypothetical protein ACI4KI_04930 [Candidatus Fimenecus sp.]